ncbi:MAG: DNA mismatch repair protein MutS [Geobacteraceae bacterium]|nr:DNA mismatch repair protein MutS [Geobacteraceae bacterium]
MKKNKDTKEKKKGFSNAPFKGLKSFAVQEGLVSPAAPRKAAPAPPVHREEDDDAALFLRYMEGIPRLDGAKQQKAPPPKPPETPDTELDEEEKKLFLSSLTGMDVSFRDEFPDVKPLRPLPVNRMRQLKTGAIRIDLELDLHGLTRDEALKSLESFVSGAYNRGQKAILVITGKGNNSPAEPVLQGAVASWLRETGKKMVAEFAPAPLRMGGNGAFVVFLKEKKRSETATGTGNGSMR